MWSRATQQGHRDTRRSALKLSAEVPSSGSAVTLMVAWWRCDPDVVVMRCALAIPVKVQHGRGPPRYLAKVTGTCCAGHCVPVLAALSASTPGSLSPGHLCLHHLWSPHFLLLVALGAGGCMVRGGCTSWWASHSTGATGHIPSSCHRAGNPVILEPGGWHSGATGLHLVSQEVMVGWPTGQPSP